MAVEKPRFTKFNGKHHLNLSESQAVQRKFEDIILPPSARVPSIRIMRFMQEVEELTDLTKNVSPKEFDVACRESEGFAKAVGGEAIDVIIVALGIIDALGLNAEQLFMQKMEVNFFKYSMDKMRELTEVKGMTHDEAQAELKRQWNDMFPKDEYGNHPIE